MDTYYSQHGEDFLIDRIFKGKNDGFYVEIGCLDGIEFSNTYFFEKKGWHGVCIEAHQDFIVPLKKNRPNSAVVHCAVGEEDKEAVTFYANKIGSLSTLDKNEEERWISNYKEYFHGFEEQKVRMSTLTTIFDELAVKSIDFVSLDIEGYEVQALMGLDFRKYRPTLFIIEYKDEAHQARLNQILLPQGYSLLSKLGCNLFYSLESGHKAVVDAPYGVVKLLQIDMNGKEHWHKADQLSPNLYLKVRRKLSSSIVGKVWRHGNGLLNRLIDQNKVPSYRRKRSILNNYRKRYALKVFVETGTFLGDTVAFFKDKFEHLYSIELSEELYSGAKARFVSEANISIIHGDSGIVLRTLVPEINRQALYWLDGHYSSEFFIGDRFIRTAKGEKVTPIINELDILLNDVHQHIILIDDARLFNGQSDYPKLEEIFELIKVSRHRYNMFVESDIIRILPKSTS